MLQTTEAKVTKMLKFGDQSQSSRLELELGEQIDASEIVLRDGDIVRAFRFEDGMLAIIAKNVLVIGTAKGIFAHLGACPEATKRLPHLGLPDPREAEVIAFFQLNLVPARAQVLRLH